jgi:hypothetical protein
MKNQEQIIAQVQETLDQFTAEQLVQALDGLQSSQGPWSVSYLVKQGYFTEEVVDLCESLELAAEYADPYCLAIEHIIDEIKANPKAHYLDDKEIATFTDEDYRDLAEADGWVWTAYEHLIAKIYLEVSNDLEA